jgi:hypothetical protein
MGSGLTIVDIHLTASFYNTLEKENVVYHTASHADQKYVAFVAAHFAMQLAAGRRHSFHQHRQFEC